MKKIFGLTAILFSSSLLAQDTATLQAVTVTANKFSTKTTETGKVVVTISREQLEKAGSRDLAQVITEFGGVFVNGYNGNAGKEKNIYLRGAKVDYTLIAIDGMPVYDASGIGSNFDIRNVSVDNVERIEILKGSQSTLYGSDAIAGVINIITRKGSTKPFAVSGVAEYGSYQTFRGNVALSGQQKKADYNISLSHFKTQGFSEAKQPVAATEPFEKDGYKQTALQANFGFQLRSNIRLQPFFRYSHFSGDLDYDAFQDEKDYTNKNNNLETGIRSSIGVGKGQLSLQYQFTHTKRDYLNDSAYRTGYYVYNQQQYTANEHFAEGFLVYPFGPVKLTVGADARISKTGSSAVQSTMYSAKLDTALLSDDSVKQHQVGIYTALNYNRGGLSVEGGGRLNHHSTYGNNFAFNFNPSYFFAKKIKMFANVSTGYKTPSLYQLFSVYGNKNLKPETSLNLEAGIQAFVDDQKGDIRFTYFKRKIKDAIAFFFDPVTYASFYINQDKQNDNGVNVDAQYKWSDKLQLRTTFSYVTGKITTLQDNKEITYFNLLRQPKSLFTFSAASQLTKAFYVNAQLTAVGRRSDVYFDPVTFDSNPIVLGSYVLLNFSAEYSVLNNRLKFFADLRNLTDRNYMDIYGYNTARFNAYGGVRFRL